MKTNFVINTIICSLFFLAGEVHLKAKNKTTDPDTSVYLEVISKISKPQRDKYEGYKALLLHNNAVVDFAIMKQDKPFCFFLKKDCYYSIKITKKGCLPLLISICTFFSERQVNYNYFKFYFDIKLMEESELKKRKVEAINFPATAISFNYEMQCFYYSEEYASGINRTFYEVD